MKHIASVSWGKDSLAMLFILIEKNYPLDEVVFYDTGMEFKAIYETRDKMLPTLKAKGIKYVELNPEYDFKYMMFDKLVNERSGGIHYGYSWCGGACRWGTTAKLSALRKYCKNAIQYVGIAANEQERFDKAKYENKRLILVEEGMTEKDCLNLCYYKGFYWEENGIMLYDILDRVSCWCCANKNLKELKNIYTYLPQYWDKLKKLQQRTTIPMKKLKNKKYGEYGNVFELEKVFQKENKK